MPVELYPIIVKRISQSSKDLFQFGNLIIKVFHPIKCFILSLVQNGPHIFLIILLNAWITVKRLQYLTFFFKKKTASKYFKSIFLAWTQHSTKVFTITWAVFNNTSWFFPSVLGLCQLITSFHLNSLKNGMIFAFISLLGIT